MSGYLFVLGLVLGVIVGPYVHDLLLEIEAKITPPREKPMMLGYLPANFDPWFDSKSSIQAWVEYFTLPRGIDTTYTVTNHDPRPYVDLFYPSNVAR